MLILVNERSCMITISDVAKEASVSVSTVSRILNKDKEFIDIIDKAAANGEVFKVYAVTILVALVFLAIVVALILGFYYLIYGLLLKSLNRNYIELKKLEV